MNNELIPILQQTFNNEPIQCVNARDLWKFLDSKREFATWIKDRLLDFIEGQDFLTISSKTLNVNGGRPVTEYHITIETAKHIAMIERNEKGRQIRKYFIDIEKHAKQNIASLSRKEILMIALEAEEKAERLTLENKQKAEIIKEYIQIDESKSYTEIAKILHLKPLSFIEYLRKNEYIGLKNIPRQEYINRGYFEIKKVKALYQDTIRYVESYRVTNKGLQYFFNKFKFDRI